MQNCHTEGIPDLGLVDFRNVQEPVCKVFVICGLSFSFSRKSAESLEIHS